MVVVNNSKEKSCCKNNKTKFSKCFANIRSSKGFFDTKPCYL